MEWWHSLLPSDIRSHAYVASNGELAWARDDALAVIDFLSGVSLRVLGVDVWGMDEDGPTLSSFVYDLDVGGESSESAARCAQSFIQSFRWDEADPVKGLIPFFNITVDSGPSTVH